MLSEVRIAKGLELSDVEKVTKIRAKFLEAIEQDAYHRLPSPIYAQGFVKNYSEFLGLDSNKILAFFRRQTTEVKHATILPKKSEKIGEKGFRITPGVFITLLIAGFTFLFLLYFGLQYRRLQLPPRLAISEPKNESISREKKLDIFGETSDDATVTVNGVSVTVRSDGKFFTQINLEPGVNTITVIATSRFGKTKTETLKIGLQQ